uniref:NADH dehydrogenase subunit 2 n=1 Tax=Alectorobius puertoricensis TaxID=48824 RepID=UPI002237A2FC|nr:NADH dehydrogenase subunit 2 [Alectorobius puertoricensis]UYB78535.1 NADH dehydrogenase subunit 2 [Alectorobius puertoricensis]UYB78548.1 NADH dehydrogenase subunit 2 [Alectorobius puertoricensis]
MMLFYSLFLWFIFMSIIMALSSSSLFFLWLCMEINMMSFIPLMLSKNFMSMNMIMLYFLVQSSASSIYIFSISMFFINSQILQNLSILINISMLMKLGAAPFHMWFPLVSESLSYNMLSILLTIQKMIPLYILSLFISNLVLFPIIISATVGSFGGFNQFSIRKILAFSSISHLAWIMTLQLLESNFWFIYLLLYSTIVMTIIMAFNIHFINFYNFSKKINPSLNLLLIFMLLSLGGMPPTLGFAMKWMTLKIISKYMMILSIPLILSSLINLFFYLRISYNSMMKFNNFYKWEKSMLYKLIAIISSQLMIIFILIPWL